MSLFGRPRRAWRGDGLASSIRVGIAVIAAAAVAGWLLLALATQYLRTYNLASEALRLERHKRELLIQNANLIGEIHRLRTDDRYVERVAREQLGMVRPGEIEFVIVPGPPDRHAVHRQVAVAGVRGQPGEEPWPFVREIQGVVAYLRSLVMRTHVR